MIYTIGQFTLIKELSNFTIDSAFLCKPIWGTILHHRSPSPDIIWGE